MDPRTTKDWVTIVRDVGPWDDGPLVKGFHMDQRLHLRGVTFKVEWTLQEVEPPFFARWEGKGPARARAIIEDRLTPTATARTSTTATSSTHRSGRWARWPQRP